MFYTICGTKLRNTINSHKHEYLNLTSPQPIPTIFGHFKATGLNLESNLDHLFAIYPYFSYCGVTEWFLSFESGSGLSYLPKFVVYLECLETELQHNGYVYHLTLHWQLSSGDKVIVSTNWKILRSWKNNIDQGVWCIELVPEKIATKMEKDKPKPRKLINMWDKSSNEWLTINCMVTY